jgi:hypothetical protein
LRGIASQPGFRDLHTRARERLIAQLRHEAVQQIAPGPLAELINDIYAVRARRIQQQGTRLLPRPDLDTELRRAAEFAIRETMSRARSDVRADAAFAIQCLRIPPDKPTQIDGRLGKFGGSVDVSLPASWLNRVWLRDLASVEGFLVLDVDAPAQASIVRARAVHWHRCIGGESVPVVVDCLLGRQSGRWRLTWA